MADEAALYVRAVVELQLLAERLGQCLGIGGVFAAVPVVAFQAAGDDGLGHRLAARTAHGPRLAEHAGLEAAAGGDRQAAVVAGQGRSWALRFCSLERFVTQLHDHGRRYLFLEQAPLAAAFLAEQFDEATALDGVGQLPT